VRILIKLGGTLLDAVELRQSLAEQIAAQTTRGAEITVVHGGGKRMTRFLSERGVESRFVNGLRVTTPEILDAALSVLAGSVNQELVASLIAAGARAVGLSGIDGNLVEAQQMNAELGLVGRVVRANPELLDVLVANGFVPVVACLAGDGRGHIYNINADQMAAACACAWHADRLIFLTDIAGVLDSAGRVQAVLTREDSTRLIGSGVATDGMEAKLNAACAAIDQGVEQVSIVPGAAPDVLARVLRDQPPGTRIVRMAERATAHD
jgi:acetylglutamate kinase